MMAFAYQLLCEAEGMLVGDVSASLRNPTTGHVAMLPAGSVVERVAAYRNGNVYISPGCGIRLGIAGDLGRYIDEDAATTTDLNNGTLVVVGVTQGVGLSEDAEVLLTLSPGSVFTTGGIIFEITYRATN